MTKRMTATEREIRLFVREAGFKTIPSDLPIKRPNGWLVAVWHGGERKFVGVRYPTVEIEEDWHYARFTLVDAEVVK